MLALKTVLEQAIKERTPQAYQRLTASKTLEPTLERLMGAHEQSLEDAMGQATDELSRQNSPNFQPDPWKRAQEFATRERIAQETALMQAIEEIDSFQTTTDTTAEN